MLEVLVKVAELAREDGAAATSVYEPASAHSIGVIGHMGPISFEFERSNFRGAPYFAAGCHRLVQHVLVERAPVHLECGQPRLIFRAQFHAIVERLIGPVREPHSQSLFRKMMMPEIIR